MLTKQDYRVSVAPMMDWTDRYCRAFHRLLSRRVRLYSEMITAEAVLHGDRERLLAFDPTEHPVALQLGGCDPVRLAEAARIAMAYGYCEVNLNVGCPSDRVQDGRFGACLMREPALVGACVAAMKAAVPVPVTVKCRIGVDDQDPETALDGLADSVVASGVDALAVHARKAWLKGLSPKENRDIPPLDYDRVYRLKQRLPDLPIILNGGVTDLDQVERHLASVDGVMLGRAAYHDPWLLAGVDSRFFDEEPLVRTPREAVEALIPLLARERANGVPLGRMTRHILGLFQNVRGARSWRRILTVDSVKRGAGIEVVEAALAAILDGEGVFRSATSDGPAGAFMQP